MPSDGLFLITAATGKTGMPAAAALIERGLRVRALVHRLDERTDQLTALGAEIVQGDLLDLDDVSSALAGVDGAYFCFPIDPGRLLEATVIFAQAATEAGVRSVVNMSQISARRHATSHAARQHWLAERLLDRTTFITTHIRPTFFAEWLTMQWSRRNDEAVLRLPFGAGRHAPIAAADQGRFVASVLANPEPHNRQIYPLCGPVELNHYEIADKLSGLLEIPVRYQPVEIPEFAAALKSQGRSPFLVQHLSSVAQDYRDGIFAGANNLIEVVTGTPAMTVEEFARANRTAFDGPGLAGRLGEAQAKAN
ncbi:NmrA family transcriptional regulator [Mycobacterium colombiense]|uniref:NmrA family transcriptional regulator n=1 Tax=Mycobacterium colombiense TaxID=339268 RepID=A0A329KZG6_9MYCO|nr:NmrA family NAD(P)-binding protein [Mycobacterium colombiense]RAU99401.1 NmrA family transcriptional regulator [Mycobacterium colombiense]